MKAQSQPAVAVDKQALQPSAARRVYQDLRQQIIDMALLPGTRINEKDIAQTHGTSRTPVHEAVQRLADEGLIEIMPRVGTFVARIPLDTLEEAMLVRTALELAIAAKAAERADAPAILRLQDILKAQRYCAQQGDTRGFHQGDEAFHAALAEISGHPGVWPMVLQAKTQIDRYRRLTLPMPGRMEGVVDEHEAVVAAIANNDSNAATAAMRVHLDHVLPILEVTRTMRPEYFIAHLPTATPPR
ncbi:GntR family transcriptional regulator [Amantichitinum ursilacus]|uniref:Putative HTH-type transcriptional regulator YdfH n=1 Tax=Amantichitinum ursilacus TaxID=857265 RepID=A0A0N0XL37_9NEIS|nr:GntR family transcriptional regulator [Amantichitinum ursilacus]KPC55202.1 putative HTH-type transcriptional regulator YdfH [Amantichitinum ursilacus]